LASLMGRSPPRQPEPRSFSQLTQRLASRQRPYQTPVFGIDVHGSAGGFASPFCNSSIECRSGERTKAIWPSRGGRLMVMPSFISRAQVA